MKTEPDTFSWDDLVRAPKRTTSWEGVRNYQARNLMRDEMRVGDHVFIYHSSCAEPGIAGTATVVKAAHPDMTALNPKSPYYDPKSEANGESRWAMVAVQAAAVFTSPVTLQQLRQTDELADMVLLRRGSRLSVQPVTAAAWALICKLGRPQAV